MNDRVLIVGGTGRIGSSVARDLLAHTDAHLTITGRNAAKGEAVRQQLGERVDFLQLDLNDRDRLRGAIGESHLTIHTAGPFHDRDGRVLDSCIAAGVNYLDVSDDRTFTKTALAKSELAREAGITAAINTGIFPGVSNSLTRYGVERLDEAETIEIAYVVGGSGGAGVTVMRTTFLGLQAPFEAWIDGKWQVVEPYSDRETVDFGAPYGQIGVYWFDMPEVYTLPQSFPVKTAIAKFGSAPDLYNRFTWIVARSPAAWLKNHAVVEFLSYVSYAMTALTDRAFGIGVVVRSRVSGRKNGQPATICTSVAHPDTAIVTGMGAGAIAQRLLEGSVRQPGVFPVERLLPTDLFLEGMTRRGIKIEQTWESSTAIAPDRPN
ncbi:saccharopine dehydrogenase family protein [Oxynema aestuarii]|jgi:saccharopine dehydrogenase-like NADP-dependent oxidoreductase|uniref:KR domain-containing protein n=1 Tax=Oxynema aestuarii AP17 TaxID=2064643 RepID=A0A6H1TUR1_9CYAN|nr:saccharopine dehydrogenase NADP-binding domain-containing protein [Oxynema aestuarii]QIZ69887.1 KR domain-containing protein [Oxynema aestuarii AP17]RMH72071.1 MAG: KR domain-containing protein [Cyanobacteria bacterium J007]